MSTGAVLSQVPHRRQQAQLSREGSLQIVLPHQPGPLPQPPPLSDTWTRISQVRGSWCQRVRCSHSSSNAVSRPSSVGRVPDSPKLPTSLSPSPTSHHHVNPGVFQPSSQPPSSIRSVAPNPLVWRRCEFKNPFTGEGGKRTVGRRWPGWPHRPGRRCSPPASQRARGVGARRSEEAQRSRTAKPRSA